MGKKSKTKKPSNSNPWNHQESALELLQKQYPDTPQPVLLRAWSIYDQTRRLSEHDRKEVNKKLDAMPDQATFWDYDNDNVQLEFKCVEMVEPVADTGRDCMLEALGENVPSLERTISELNDDE